MHVGGWGLVPTKVNKLEQVQVTKLGFKGLCFKGIQSQVKKFKQPIWEGF